MKLSLRALICVACIASFSAGALAQTDSANVWQLSGKPGLPSDQAPPPPNQGMTGGWSRYFVGQTKCTRAPRYYFDTCAQIRSDGSIIAWDYWHPTQVVAWGTSGYGGVSFWGGSCWDAAWSFIVYPAGSTADQTFGRVPGDWVLRAWQWVDGGGCG